MQMTKQLHNLVPNIFHVDNITTDGLAYCQRIQVDT